MAHPDLQRRRKHPHERGEDITNLVEKPREWETPPRAWGRPGSLSSFVTKPGNTPTSVGKTDSCATSCRPHEKHPHERGEDLRRNEAAIAAVETPPRAWGRPPGVCAADAGAGNTPTSVGKTECHCKKLTRIQKHPHERGEDVWCRVRMIWLLETPPRAWGRRPGKRVPCSPEGNTPTSVGKTTRRSLI